VILAGRISKISDVRPAAFLSRILIVTSRAMVFLSISAEMMRTALSRTWTVRNFAEDPFA
jgi:hypothetical protein